MAKLNSMIWISSMNHNENDFVVNNRNVYFHQFENVAHENLWYAIDEHEHIYEY